MKKAKEKILKTAFLHLSAGIFLAGLALTWADSAEERVRAVQSVENMTETEKAEPTECVWDGLHKADQKNDSDFPEKVAAGNAGSENALTPIMTERLPERWYAGDCGKKPTVRHQGSSGTCWAFAAAAALEAALLPGQHIVFSADHMSRKNAFTVGLDEGGDYLMAMAYLSGWQGPVTEEEDPYGDGVSPDGLTPAVHVQEIQLLEDAESAAVKAAVLKYGAVQTSLYMRRSTERGNAEDDTETSGRDTVFCYNERTKSYFCPDERTPNHDVIILGWDDDYSRFLFSEAPEKDGAFICQNTWEEGFGEDGIFYVSYADPNIAKTCVCYTRIEPTDNYSKIYQYDDCGWQGRQGYADESCWFANVYAASATAGGSLPAGAGGELLAAVGFYAVGPDTSYEIYLVRDFHSETDFSGMEYLQKGKLQNSGYYTVNLQTPQFLTAGERFVVVVKITTPGEENPVAVEYRADKYTQNVTTEGKEGYLSLDGKRWENTEERFGTNVCLKAYTATSMCTQ